MPTTLTTLGTRKSVSVWETVELIMSELVRKTLIFLYESQHYNMSISAHLLLYGIILCVALWVYYSIFAANPIFKLPTLEYHIRISRVWY